MESIINRYNKAKLFNFENQFDEKITFMMCTIYFAFINAKYNGVIKDFTEDKIKFLAKRLFEKNKFSYKNGGKIRDGLDEVLLHFDEEGIERNLGVTTKDSKVKEWISKEWAVGIGIGVNDKFYPDTKDGELNFEDYKDYQGETYHATNIFNNKKEKQDYFLDSGKKNIYTCNIDEVLQDIDLNTKYIIY